MSGYYLNRAFLQHATANTGYHVFLPQVVCLKRKPQINGLFLRVLHILGQEKKCLWLSRLLQAMLLYGTVVTGYYLFNVSYYGLLLLYVTMYFYYKCYGKNGSNTLKPSPYVYCTYLLKPCIQQEPMLLHDAGVRFIL